MRILAFKNKQEKMIPELSSDPPLYVKDIITYSYLEICDNLTVCSTYHFQPGRVAQSEGHLTHKSGLLGLIPSGNILSFLLPLFQEGQLSVTGESMCTKYWLTA